MTSRYPESTHPLPSEPSLLAEFFTDEKAGPSDLSWTARRERLVQQALEDDDLEALRRISALPGGYGSDRMRKKVWPVLLRVAHYSRDGGERHDHDGDETGDGVDGNGHSVVTVYHKDTSKVLSADGHEADLLDGPAAGINRSEVHSNINKPHPDEHQVQLDTKRSFVSYPRGLPADSKLAMQADLHDLIVGVLRKYPVLSYFQGYHDILSVFYLTYIPPPPPPEPRSRTSSGDQSRSASRAPHRREKPDVKKSDGVSASKKDIPLISSVTTAENCQVDVLLRDNSRGTEQWRTLRLCGEVVSACRVRDAMGKGMDGMMGLLRILQRLLRAADPELYNFSSSISPVPTLPFFALSWILCLFSHDVDTLEPVQRMFDFLLARNPISAIYLAVAILIAKKPQMVKLAKKLGSEAQDDPSLLHPLFSSLPPLFPDTPEEPMPLAGHREARGLADHEEPNPYQPIRLSQVFALTDQLLAKYPWDGDVIRGKDIMGSGSVVSSYEHEIEEDWTIQSALKLVDREVVKPGAADPEEEGEEEDPVRMVKHRPVWRLRVPRNKAGVALAVGVMFVGVGLAVYGGSSGGRGAWGVWWAAVVRKWVGKGVMTGRAQEIVDGWRGALRYLSVLRKDLL